MELTANKFSDKTAIKATAMVERLDLLSCQRAEFESTDLARSNQKLYGLLANVYQHFEEAAQSPAVLKVTVDALTTRIKARGQRVQQNSAAMSVFVRYVFDSDRQRIFTYTRAIQAAKASGITPENFPTFVENAHGLEECASQTPSGQVAQRRKQQVASSIPVIEEILADGSGPILAEFTVDVALIKNLKDAGKAFMIGTYDQNGNIRVRSVIPAYSSRVEKWAKTKIAEYLHVAQERVSQDAAGAEYESAIDKASAALSKTVSGTVKVGELA